MYQHSYAETLADSSLEARATEHRALDDVVRRLNLAASSEPKSPEEQAALDMTSRLWATFIKDLASPGNDLPGPLRASLISIGLGILSEVQRIELGLSRDFAGLADICGAIRDGLA